MTWREWQQLKSNQVFFPSQIQILECMMLPGNQCSIKMDHSSQVRATLKCQVKVGKTLHISSRWQ